MSRFLPIAGAAAVLILTGAIPFSAQAPAPAASPVVVFETSKGAFDIETLPADAPKSVERFLELAKRAFYRGHRFHFVRADLVQSGDPLSRDMTQRGKWGTGGSGPRFVLRPIGVAETSKRSFTRGIVGLAYLAGQKPESVDSQFFIVKTDNPTLNGKYPVIGRVTRGMAVVDRLTDMDSIKSMAVK